ncbi:MAG: ABC transporter permease, partial [Actinobacteria bacterium]
MLDRPSGGSWREGIIGVEVGPDAPGRRHSYPVPCRSDVPPDGDRSIRPGAHPSMAAVTHEGFELQGERSRLLPLLRDLWRSRTLIRTLAKKDFFVKYRRASIGVLWAVGLPLIQALVLSVIFSRIVRFQTPIRYPVYVFSGMMPWTFFSGSINTAVTAIVDGAGIATKVYFPRAVLPIVTVWSGFHGYLPALGVLILLAALLHVHLGLSLLLMIPATMLTVALTTGFSLLFAALHVYFRDMRYIVQAIMFPWLWASAIMYPLYKIGSLVRYVQYNPVLG